MQPGHEQLAEWIAKRGVTQRETAERIGVHENMVSLLLRGKRKPGLTLAVTIENELGIPVRSWTVEKLSDSEKRVFITRVK